MLVLFDIDATLIRTSRAGVAAMHETARDLFHPEFELGGVEFGGCLDPIIMRDLLRRNGQEAHADSLARWRDAYGRRLADKLAAPGVGHALPGVFELLRRLESMPEITLGLLTGNFPETGAAKLRACGIDPRRFALQLYATDSPFDPPARAHLPAVALDRYSERLGRAAHPKEAVVIGDTPNDVHCALANDCWVIGVATGTFSKAELAARGAHWVVDDLTGTHELAQWIAARRSFVP
jgi:phosphoglycolate phosphatase